MSMARPLRNTDPQYFRLVTIRTHQALLFLVPSSKLNEIVGGVLAKYQEEFQVEIYSYIFLSNHFHLLLRAPRSNLPQFMQSINREIAKRINKLLGRRGHFWERRYDDQIIGDDNDMLEAFLYLHCNPVSHGLVNHPKHWPGLKAYWQTLDETDRKYKFFHYTEYEKALKRAQSTGDKVIKEDFEKEYCLKLSVLPRFAKLSKKQRGVQLTQLIEERVEEIAEGRLKAGRGFLGRKRILKQDTGIAPREVKRQVRPICYTKNFEVKKEFMSWYFPWVEAYREASKRFRRKEYSISFPEFSIPPPINSYLLPA